MTSKGIGKMTAGCRILIPISLVAALLSTAHGAEPPSGTMPAYVHCVGVKTGVAAQILACVALERGWQERRLTVAYAKTLRDLPPARRAGLKVTLAHWIAYRNAWRGITNDPTSGPDEQIALAE